MTCLLDEKTYEKFKAFWEKDVATFGCPSRSSLLVFLTWQECKFKKTPWGWGLHEKKGAEHELQVTQGTGDRAHTVERAKGKASKGRRQ